MLRELQVEGLGVIERAELTLEEGTTALTGETGAGKTLVVAAVSLLMGGRSDRELVRPDSGEARLEGRFEVPADHPAVEALLEAGILESPPEGPTEVVVFRTVGLTGGGRIRVNGRIATAQLLQQVTGALVEIAGQNEHQRLGQAATQRALLDGYAKSTSLATEVRENVRAAAAATRRLEDVRAKERETAEELTRLNGEIGEISAAAVRPGEWEELTSEAARLENAASVATAIEGARDALRGESSAQDALASAQSFLHQAAGADPELAVLADRVQAAVYEIADVADELAKRFLEPDPGRLETIRERLETLGRLRRRFGADEAAVLAHLDAANARVAAIEQGTEDVAALEARVETSRKEVQDLTARLSARRKEAAARLEAEMNDMLPRLALTGTRFHVEVAERELYEGGIDSVELSLSSGDEPRPLAKVASGGELSRIALALHLITRSGSGPTVIFDEVDAGVGGEAARAVGQALADLGRLRGTQVVVVTHLPQVAALADHHFRVIKDQVGARVRTRVEPLEGEDRVEEISRMLSGHPDSQSAREHAQELLARSGPTAVA